MAQFKRNVTLTFTTTVLWIIEAYDMAMQEVTGKAALITGGLEGAHSEESGHYHGRSVDARSHHLTKDQKARIIDLMLRWLHEHAQGRYYVAVEQPETNDEHFHAQRDKDSM